MLATTTTTTTTSTPSLDRHTVNKSLDRYIANSAAETRGPPQANSHLWESFSVVSMPARSSKRDKEFDDLVSCPGPVVALYEPQSSRKKSSKSNVTPTMESPTSSRGRKGRKTPIKKKGKGNISFDGNVQIFSVVPMFELAKSPEKIWFQAKDFEKMGKKIDKIVRKIEEGEQQQAATGTTTDDDELYDVRGLEGKLKSQQAIVQSHQKSCWDAVFQEQRRQKQEGIEDEKALYKIARHSSSSARKLAEERAQQDEKDVESYLNNGERYYCRTLNIEVFYEKKYRKPNTGVFEGGDDWVEENQPINDISLNDRPAEHQQRRRSSSKSIERLTQQLQRRRSSSKSIERLAQQRSSSKSIDTTTQKKMGGQLPKSKSADMLLGLYKISRRTSSASKLAEEERAQQVTKDVETFLNSGDRPSRNRNSFEKSGTTSRSLPKRTKSADLLDTKASSSSSNDREKSTSSSTNRRKAFSMAIRRRSGDDLIRSTQRRSAVDLALKKSLAMTCDEEDGGNATWGMMAGGKEVKKPLRKSRSSDELLQSSTPRTTRSSAGKGRTKKMDLLLSAPSTSSQGGPRNKRLIPNAVLDL